LAQGTAREESTKIPSQECGGKRRGEELVELGNLTTALKRGKYHLILNGNWEKRAGGVRGVRKHFPLIKGIAKKFVSAIHR